jgi:hypothetical protein
MGLSDDECLPRARDGVMRCVSGFGGQSTPLNEIDVISSFSLCFSSCFLHI